MKTDRGRQGEGEGEIKIRTTGIKDKQARR